MAESKKQVCRVMITFPITDNMQALAYKDKLDKLFEDNDKANVQFVIMNIPDVKNVQPKIPMPATQ